MPGLPLPLAAGPPTSPVTKYWVGGTGTWNGTTTTNWSLTSGGTGGASPPTSIDPAVFDVNSGTSNVITVNSGAACSSLTVQGMTSGYTFTMNTNLAPTGAVNISGNLASARHLVQGGTVGTAQTLTINSLSRLTNVDFMDITVNGTAAPISGGGLGGIGNALGNSGITFTPSRTIYFVNVSGGSTNTSASWSLTSGGSTGQPVPLPQDDLIFDANSITSAGATITFAQRGGRNVDMSNLANAPTLSFNNQAFYGNLTLPTAALGGWTGSQSSIILRGRGAQTIKTNGRTISKALTIIDLPSGTYTLLDNLADSVSVTLQGGTLDPAGFLVTPTPTVISGTVVTYNYNRTQSITQATAVARSVTARKTVGLTQGIAATRAIVASKTASQTQATTTAIAKGLIRLVSLSATTAATRRTSSSRALVAVQNSTAVRGAQTSRTLSLGETITPSLTKLITSRRSATQASIATVIVATNTFFQTMTTTQGSTATRGSIDSRRLNASASATAALGIRLSRLVTTNVATGVSIIKSLTVARAVTQATGITVLGGRGYLRTVTVTQGSTATRVPTVALRKLNVSEAASPILPKQIASVRSVTQAESISVRKSLTRSVITTQPTVATKATAMARALSSIQGTSATRSILVGKSIVTTQTTAAVVARTFANTRIVTVTQAETIGLRKTVSHSSPTTQATTAIKSDLITRVVSTTQANVATRRTAIAKPINVTQTTSSVVGRAFFNTRIVIQPQSTTFIGQRSFNRTLTLIQGSASLVTRQIARIIKPTQATTVTRKVAVTQTRILTQASSATKSLTRFRTATTTQSTGVQVSTSGHAQPMTTAQSVSVTRKGLPQAVRAVTQSEELSVRRAITTQRTLAQPTVANTIKRINTTQRINVPATPVLTRAPGLFRTLTAIQTELANVTNRNKVHTWITTQATVARLGKSRGKVLTVAQPVKAIWRGPRHFTITARQTIAPTVRPQRAHTLTVTQPVIAFIKLISGWPVMGYLYEPTTIAEIYFPAAALYDASIINYGDVLKASLPEYSFNFIDAPGYAYALPEMSFKLDESEDFPNLVLSSGPPGNDKTRLK